MTRPHCNCRPYHVVDCPAHGEDNRRSPFRIPAHAGASVATSAVPGPERWRLEARQAAEGNIYYNADAWQRTAIVALDALDAEEAELERHRRANLLRAVLDGVSSVEEFINEAVNEPEFDQVPWQIAQAWKATADDLAARLEALLQPYSPEPSPTWDNLA